MAHGWLRSTRDRWGRLIRLLLGPATFEPTRWEREPDDSIPLWEILTASAALGFDATEFLRPRCRRYDDERRDGDDRVDEK